MSSLLSIAQSGMQAAQTRLNTSAHNVANAATEGFRRETVQAAAQPQAGVRVTLSQAAVEGANLAQDVVDRLSAKQSFAANVAVAKTADRVMGSLLDIRA